MSLAGWAEQFGQSDMLATLSSTSPANNSASTLRRRDEEDANAERNSDKEVMASPSRGAGEGGGGEEDGEALTRGVRGGEVPDDVGMFVEELKVNESLLLSWASVNVVFYQ